jgi:hypothetical protein
VPACNFKDDSEKSWFMISKNFKTLFFKIVYFFSSSAISSVEIWGRSPMCNQEKSANSQFQAGIWSFDPGLLRSLPPFFFNRYLLFFFARIIGNDVRDYAEAWKN